ncbi:MAG: PIG-L family deacetylase [Candidatus Hodarchaeales archaeon]|jgi:LmbE family N-acetylglucosaminyl deacetylase
MNDRFDVIAVSPHPDDAEIGCGGTLALLAKELGYRVGIIDLTNGEPTPFNDNPDIRIRESLESAKILGVERILLDLPNRKLMDSIPARLALAKAFRQTKPALVIGMQGMTQNGSPDHYQGQLIFDAAVFYSRLSKWEHYFEGLPPWRIEHSFYYFTAREFVLTTQPLQFITNISNQFETKKKALLAYKSQFKAHFSYNPPIVNWIEGMGRYFGTLAGCEYGEIFYGTKILNINLFKQFLDT